MAELQELNSQEKPNKQVSDFPCMEPKLSLLQVYYPSLLSLSIVSRLLSYPCSQFPSSLALLLFALIACDSHID